MKKSKLLTPDRKRGLREGAILGIYDTLNKFSKLIDTIRKSTDLEYEKLRREK